MTDFSLPRQKEQEMIETGVEDKDLVRTPQKPKPAYNKDMASTAEKSDKCVTPEKVSLKATFTDKDLDSSKKI